MSSTTNKGGNKGGGRVRQMTDQERALEAAAEQVAGEVLGLDPVKPTTVLGRVAAAGRRAISSVAQAGRRVKALATRENAEAALDHSAAFAKMAATYGKDAAKAAVMRRVRQAIDDKVEGLVGGSKAKANRS